MNQSTKDGLRMEHIDLGKLVPSKTNPRKVYDTTGLNQLAASIREHKGVLEPLIVRPIKSGRYEIIAGERRFRASKKTVYKQVLCRVVEADDVQAIKIQTSENNDRVNLSPIEEAVGWQNLLSVTGMTQIQAAKEFKRDQSYISNRLRLLKLPKVWQKKLINRVIPLTFARDLAGWIDNNSIAYWVDYFWDYHTQHLAPGQTFELAELRNILAESISKVSRPIEDAATLSMTPKLREELDVRKMPETLFGPGVERVFDTIVLAQLLQELEEEIEEQQTIPEKKQTELELSTEIANEHAERGKEFSDRVANQDDDDSVVEKSPEEVKANIDHAQEVADRNKAAQGPTVDYTKYKLDLIRRQIASRLDDDDFVFRVGFDCLDNLADWKPDEPFLKLHNHGQLLGLAREWGLDMSRLEGYETASQTMIDEILILTTQQWIDFGDDVNQRPNPPRELIITGSQQ